MRIESLKYLVDFAETGSVSSTAARNFMSEQGMGRVFRQLEKELGMSLFVREGKNLRLTEGGQAVVEKSRNVVEDYLGIQDVVSFYVGQTQTPNKEFCLYVTPLSMLCIVPLLDVMQPNLFPFLVNINECDLGSLSGNLRTKDALGIVSIPLNAETTAVLDSFSQKGLSFIPLIESEVGVLLPASSPLAPLGVLPHERYRRCGRGNLGVACPNDTAVIQQIKKKVDQSNLRLVTNNFQLLKRQIRRGQVAVFLPRLILASMEIGRGIAFCSLKEEECEASRVCFGLVIPTEIQADDRIANVAGWVKRELVRQYHNLLLERYGTLKMED